MEIQRRHRNTLVLCFIGILLFSFIERISCLSVTVNDQECVYEYVLYEGDTISGNFVVVDHDIFWSSDHPGIDFTVSAIPSSPSRFDPIGICYLVSVLNFLFDLISSRSLRINLVSGLLNLRIRS